MNSLREEERGEKEKVKEKERDQIMNKISLYICTSKI